MDSISKEISEVLKQLFGLLAPIILLRELKDQKINNLDSSSDQEKKQFLEHFMSTIIAPVASNQKQSHIRSMLISKLKFSKESTDSDNKKALLDYARSE